MKLVFCGTPQFAVPTLQAVLEAGHHVELVVTQPDRPSGRGMALTIPPVKETALLRGLPVVQPEKLKNNLEFRAQLEAIRPDAILVVAYGRIIPKWMLDLPPQGNLNLHASLLPKYRGAAPIQWAIAMGETVTGATTMRLDEGLDTGDILLQSTLPILPDQTSVEIFPLLAQQGASLMVETLAGLAAGSITPTKQDESRATLAPILKREDGAVDFRRSAQQTFDRWRGFQPWPGAYTVFHGKKLSLSRIQVADRPAHTAEPGEILVEQGHWFLACGEGTWLEATEVQLEGKKRMLAADFLRGHALKSGEKLG
ncbi:MAG TPA: methionyl-tRNA formyltransferase [Acidisarcina sp.]|nr:methionyl-tRNA formyltransferase [Acidisarcina sp.]